VKYTLDQFRSYLRGLPKKFEKAALEGLELGAARAVPVLQRAADNAPPASANGKRGARDSGRYRGAFKWMKITDGVVIYNGMTYAGVIEKGRRKGKKPPPTRVIALWAQRRLGLSEKQAKAAAFPIARAIGRRGLLARSVFGSSRPKIASVVRTEVQASIKRHSRMGSP